MHLKNRVLIISPYFPPSNAADMQRVRMSLPYFKDLGWEAEVVTVDEKYVDISTDELLLQSIPTDIKIHKVKALNKTWTSKFGLGSIALRSLPYYRQKVNHLLKTQKFDLIYFSTTQFPVCILGPYWKKRYHIPYVIDMQDPWHSNYYQNKPATERPPKYWFSYRLNKYLEPIALKHVDGLISVSEKYINDLKNRYPGIKNVPAATITFGSFEPDIKAAVQNKSTFPELLNNAFKNIVYVGVLGTFMLNAIEPLFAALAKGIAQQPTLFSKLKIYFIGTSYAPKGQGTPSLSLLIKKYHLENCVIEQTHRISYYHTLVTLLQADALFIPGSNDPAYTASKIYPYLLTQKPLLSIFNSQSPAISTLNEYNSPYNYSYDNTPDLDLKVYDFLRRIITSDIEITMYEAEALKKHSAQNMALQQCELFNRVIK
jgi:hypothetical protein